MERKTSSRSTLSLLAPPCRTRSDVGGLNVLQSSPEVFYTTRSSHVAAPECGCLPGRPAAPPPRPASQRPAPAVAAETKREIKRLRLARFVNELSPRGWRGLVEGPEGTGWNTSDGPGHGERHPALGERQWLTRTHDGMTRRNGRASARCVTPVPALAASSVRLSD